MIFVCDYTGILALQNPADAVLYGLIERVRSGTWNLETNEGDREQRNAVAARGYWLAYHEGQGYSPSLRETWGRGIPMRRK